jgi:hypothetical protein
LPGFGLVENVLWNFFQRDDTFHCLLIRATVLRDSCYVIRVT